MFVARRVFAAVLLSAVSGASSYSAEAKVDLGFGDVVVNPSAETIRETVAKAGEMPKPRKDGSYAPVVAFLEENEDDASSLEYVKWSGVAPVLSRRETEEPLQGWWGVRLKYRSKNRLGALELREQVFIIRHGKVVALPAASSWTVPRGCFPGEGGIERLLADQRAQQEMLDDLLNPVGLTPTEPSPPPPSQPKPVGFDFSGIVKSSDARSEVAAAGITYDYVRGVLRLFNTPYGVVTQRLGIDDDETGMQSFTIDKDAKSLTDLAHRPSVTVTYNRGEISSVSWEDVKLRPSPAAAGKDGTFDDETVRVFRDATGKHETKARFVGEVNGRVILQREDGREVVVKLSDLSDVDKVWVLSRGESPTDGSP